jgi:hypothetical protein
MNDCREPGTADVFWQAWVCICGPRVSLGVGQTDIAMNAARQAGMSGHFRRQARIMVRLIIGVIGIGLLVALLAPRIGQWLAVDRCLDSGGSYNYQARVCEGARPGG